jgi:T-complex protein 1 subunit beta
LRRSPTLSLRPSFHQGFLLDKKIGVGQPKRIENARIMVANTSMDTDKIKIFGSRVKVDSLTKVADIEAAEKGKMREKVQKIVDHGINCFINRQLIYNYPEQVCVRVCVRVCDHSPHDIALRVSTSVSV